MNPPPKRRAEAKPDGSREFPGGKSQQTGCLGEDLVLARLERLGFELLGRNIRISGIELDLVLTRAGRILVTEVKTRVWPALPEESLKDWQRGRLHRALPPLARALNRSVECMDLILAAVRLHPEQEPEICFFRIPMAPRAP